MSAAAERGETPARERQAAAGPVGKIHPQPWMTSPQTRLVLEALAAGGHEVRFIGGCVRDALLKRHIRDIDIALPATPQAVMALLQAAGVRVVPTGIDHGTVTAVVGATPFEITSLRIDVESFGRHARVAYTDDWLADAARRDFTINAMSCTPDGDIYDYFRGLDDLGHGRVRFVGDAAERIAEDVLRLLRFFRFYAHYGREPPDAAALAACRAAAAGLCTLSGERVRVEIFRTLMANDPADAFALMRDDQVLEHVLPEAGGVERLRMLSWLDSKALRLQSIAPDPVRRLAALLAPSSGEAEAEAVRQRLRLSNAQGDRLRRMLAPAYPLRANGNGVALRRALYHLGAETVRDLLLLAWAGELAAAPAARGRNGPWSERLSVVDGWSPPRFPLRGRDALAIGIPHGPEIGRLLKAVEAWWEESDFAPDHAACLARLRELVGRS
ncbi:MAG: CCA tRNA nucleotidyltransferase [Rhodospirillales bacterium]|nr:CCA tRNA nucleotidyltransferase [Rhodospirillales bacterium]